MKNDLDVVRSEPARFIRIRSLVILFTIFYGCIGAIFLWWQQYNSGVIVAVPQKDLPAYHQIQKNDLTQQYFPQKSLSSSVLRDFKLIEGRYTLTAVPRYKPLNRNQLIEGNRLKNHVALGISATPSMTFGGTLQAGDLIDITLVPTKTSAPTRASIFFKDILVLSVVRSQVSMDNSSGNSFVVVIVLPSACSSKFITQQVDATVTLVRRPWDDPSQPHPQC